MTMMMNVDHFVDCPNIHGKARVMHALGQSVSSPDDKQQKTQIEKKVKSWMVAQSLV